MRDLRGKVAVVTGAGSGIGREVAAGLAAKGAAVAICDNRPEAAKETLAAIEGRGGAGTAHAVDVSSESEMRALVDEVLDGHGVVDIVVNVAGIAMAPTRATDLSLDRFRRILDVNLWGTVHGSLLFLPHLVTRPAANLVNVASNSALIAVHRLGAYSTSKFAVRGFTENLRMEFQGSPVRVSLACPGATRTAIMSNSPVIDEERRARIQQRFDAAWGQAVEKVAGQIVDGIRRDRPRILIGPDTRFADVAARLLPAAYIRLLSGAMSKAVDKALGDGSPQ